MSLRTGLFAAVCGMTLGGYLWMFLVNVPLRPSLALLTGVFTAGMGIGFWMRRHRMTGRLLTANLALGCIVLTVVGGLIVVADRLWELGATPAFSANWHHFLIGVLGLTGAAMTWTWARRPEPKIPARPPALVEPPPEPTATWADEPDWDQAFAAVGDDSERTRLLTALQRIHGADTLGETRRVVRQEVDRLFRAGASGTQEDDILSQAADLLQWGAQKLPELADLDVSDVLMAKAIADIQALHSDVERRFVDHRELRAIHPIDRPTAIEKCEARAAAARAALPELRANGMRLSEALIATSPVLTDFRSVTGFQVVELEDGYITFEGNGRREALRQAFGDDEGIQVEVRLYTFPDPTTTANIQRRVQRVRRRKGVHEDNRG